MKRQANRKSVLVAILSLLAVFAFAFAGAGCTPKERIKLDFGDRTGFEYDSATETVTIEYGATFIVPDAVVVDRKNNELDYDVDYALYDEAGEEVRMPSIVLSLDKGVYSLVFKAAGSSAKDLKLTLRVIDEAAPELTVTSVFVNAGSPNDVISLPTFRLKDISGVNHDKTAEKVTFNGEEITLSDRKFTATEAGEYRYEIYAEDTLGNGENKVILISITERYSDANVSGNALMTFDNADYARNVMRLYDSTEGSETGVVLDGIPSAANGITPSGGAYKISAPDNSVNSFLVRNNRTINSDGDGVGNIVFRVYTDELIENIVVFSPDGKREYARFKYVMAGWNELSFDAHSAVGWYDDFGDFLLRIENEDAINAYIDEIFYTKMWKDRNIGDNVLADFDEAGYKELVSNNRYSRTSGLEILTEAYKAELEAKGEDLTDAERRDKAALENASGGILKVTVNSSYDGFKVSFAKPIDADDIAGIRVRMYFPEMYRTDSKYFSVRYNFLPNDGSTPSPIWADLYNSESGTYVVGWKDYWHTGAKIKGSFTMADSQLAVGYYIAIVLDNPSDCVFYVDEISVVLKSDEIDNNIPVEGEYSDGVLADFTQERYAANVIPATSKGVSYSYSSTPESYGYAEFNDGSADTSGLKIVHDDKKWNNGTTNLSYYEGVKYVLPHSIVIRNSDNTPRIGDIVFKAYFEQADTVALGVSMANGLDCAFANQAVPSRHFSAKVGYNEFRISAKSLINEEVYDISAVWMLSLNRGTWYLTSIGYTEYVPPYNDDSFMTVEDGKYTLADFDESEYMNSLSDSSYGGGAPESLAIKTVNLDGEDCDVLEVKPSSARNNGFDYLFPRKIAISSRKNVTANFIYFKVWSPVALEKAGIGLATINLGQYSTWGHYVTPKRVTYRLDAGWNVIRLDLAQLAGEGVTEIEGLAFVTDVSWASDAAASDKVFYIDRIYMDTDYDASRAVVMLDSPVIRATKNGSAVTLVWDEVAGAESYAVKVGNAPETSVTDRTFTITDFDSSDLRVTVIARRDGSADASASWFYDSRFGKADELGGLTVAKFDDSRYDGTLSQVTPALADRKNTLSDFEATAAGMKITTYGYNKLALAGGFTYGFPFAVNTDGAKTLTFSLSYVGGLESGWSIGHSSETFFGFIDGSGKIYNAVKYSSVNSSEANTIRNDTYYDKYNNPNPVFTIDLESMRAANPDMSEICALYFSHNKSVTFTLNYIIYDDGRETLPSPELSVSRNNGKTIVSWTEVVDATGYEVLVDGVPATGIVDRSVTLTSSAVVTVKALGGDEYNDSLPVSYFADASFGTERGDGYYYLSNFDHANSALLFEGSKVLYNGGVCAPASYSFTSQMTGSGLDIDTKGVALSKAGTYGSAKFNIAEGFDLAKANSLQFVLRQNGKQERGINVGILFASGDKVFAVTDKLSSIHTAQGSSQMWSSQISSTMSFAYNCIHVGLNVQQYLSDIRTAFGSTTIDGIIFCVNTKDTDVIIVDEVFYSRVTLLTPENLTCTKTAGGYTIAWDAVDGAESYEVTIDGVKATDYVSGTSFTTSSVGLISVKAKSSAASDGAAATLFFDPSREAERGDGYYYLSNFDHASSTEMFEGSNVSWNGGECATGRFEYLDKDMKGVATKGVLMNTGENTYGAIKYNIAGGFDLSNVNNLQFVFRQNHDLAFYTDFSVKFTSGDKTFSVSSKFANVGTASGADEVKAEYLNKDPIVNYVSCAHIGLDIQSFISEIRSAFGDATIDGMIFCFKNKYDIGVVADEIFYDLVTPSE